MVKYTVSKKPFTNLVANFMIYIYLYLSEFIKALADSTEITGIPLLTFGENFAQ